MNVRRHASAYVVLAASLVATCVATFLAYQRGRDVDRRRFEDAADRAVSAIEVRLDAYISALYAGAAMFRGSSDVTREEFRDFVRGLELSRRYPGIQGLGFARVVDADGVDALEREVRANGYPSFRVWPIAPPRDRYSTIVFLEPMDIRNRRAIGFDMMSEPVRREAMTRAAQTGAPAASGRVVLVQELETEESPGFLIYLAVFDEGALRGWVYAPFRAPDLLGGMFPDTSRFAFSVHIASEPTAEALIFETEPGRAGGSRAPRTLRTQRKLNVAGQVWTLNFRSRRGLFPDSSHSVEWVAALGMLASVLLFALTRVRLRAAAAAEDRQRRATFLADAGRVLGESLDYEVTLDRVARLCVAELADWCVVHLKEEEAIRDVALVHRDPAMTAHGTELAKRFPRDPNAPRGVAQVVRTGRPELISTVPEELITSIARGPEHLALLRRLQMRSFMCVPLLSRAQTLGAITFISSVPGRFTSAELSLAQELAQLAATAVDNARLYMRAQQAIRIRDEFLSVASHELKTPLTSMTLKLETLKRVRLGSDDARERRAQEVLDRQVRRLTRLVDSLLDVSRIASGRLRLDVTDMDLMTLANEVVVALGDELSAANTPLHISGPPSLVGRWDRLRTEQVLTNLLTNAIKYGRGNPIELRIEDAGDTARLIVKDRGIGISRADLDRIFERFERAVPAANYGGLGLGLYISRQIVEALGGRIRVESAENEGSTFTVELPKAGAVADGRLTVAAEPRVEH